jgi:uncharacterized membrane protein
MKQNNLMTGVLLGAGLMYYLDPNRGHRRRSLVRDQWVHLTHRADDALDTAARDLRNRTLGMAAEARAKLRRESVISPVLEARVRTELGRLVSHPGAIEVLAEENGTVALMGPVLADEAERLLAGVEAVNGVKIVVNELSVHRTAGDIPGLQGSGRSPQPRLDILQESWAPATRLMVGALGGALALRGIRGGPIGSLLALTGLGMLGRALSNKGAKRLLGVDAGRRAVDLHKIIAVNAPLEEVFGFWRKYENFPLFMSHLKEVRMTGANRSHWVAEGPGGLPFEWDAETTAYEENRLIAWKSIGSSPVENAGVVLFQREGENATRIDVRLSYNPPAGAIGHAVAAFLGSDPKRLMDDDLVRLKSLLEEGKTTANHQPAMRAEVRRAMEAEER